MAERRHNEGDPYLQELFERFSGRMVSPGGAAALLGLSRKTIHTLGEQGKIRVFRGPDQEAKLKGLVTYDGPKWVYIPLIDLKAYAERVGRPFPEMPEIAEERDG